MAKQKVDKNALLEKIKKNTTIAETDILNKSKILNEIDFTPTKIHALNVVFSGSFRGGLSSGVTVLAGPSKNFKTFLALIAAAAYMETYPDSICLFYSSEFGSPISYFDSLNMDKDRIVFSPITNIEKLKFDIVKQLEGIDRGDKVVIVVDSIGNLASVKEIEDAKKQKSVADMTRAKAIKSLFRIITPEINLKNIPALIINHTYKSQDLFPVDVVSGGTGPYYSADNIYVIAREQLKNNTTKQVVGFKFKIKADKSRFVKEKSMFELEVLFDRGISPWTGLMEMAEEGGFVVSPKQGSYSRVNILTGEVEEEEWKLKNTYCKEFWGDFLKDEAFNIWVQNRYQLANRPLIDEEAPDISDSEPIAVDEEFGDEDDA